jgi:hypothetical protein
MARIMSRSSGPSEVPSGAQDDAVSAREAIADRLPFVLRAWWLRNYKEYESVEWYTDPTVTGSLWSLYSDPLCDQGNMDYADELL